MDDGLSPTRLYGSAIAIVSGVYSLWLATGGTAMTGGAWLMLLLGIVVLVHGVVLVTPLADSLGSASGPLMIVYAVVMLLNQAWVGARRTWWGGTGGSMGGMDGGMGGSMGAVDGGMMAGPNAGMIAIAILMLVSGVIMTVGSGDGMADEMSS
jgi:hypothetical protein